jgi:4-hydroxy-tetrahydrodipicolinate synthase
VVKKAAMSIELSGTYTALVTPFRAEAPHAIDWDGLDALVEAQIEGGVTGLVPCGTTGESPTLSHDEHKEVVRRVVKRARARAHVVAGTGSNATETAIELSQDAAKAGADAVMLVVPYYNKPTQDGLHRHFVTVAKSVDCPVVLYNIPGRTGIDLLTDTLLRIARDAPNVVGVKEATGNVLRAQEIARRSRLRVLSGDDALTLGIVAVGGRGIISVTSNVLPREVSRATDLALQGKNEEARKAHFDLLPVHEAMFLEANPGPVKAALVMKKRIASDAVRGPLVTASDATKKALAAALQGHEG